MAGSEHLGRLVSLAITMLLWIGVTASTAAPVAKSGAAPTAARPAVVAGSQRRAAAGYLAIAKAGNRSLDHYFDRLEGPDRDRLARSRSDLRAIAATERLFDRRLSRIAFPVRVRPTAHWLHKVNQRRAALTTAAARSSSLRELRDYERRLNAANGPVERAVSALRRQLGLPPPPAG